MLEFVQIAIGGLVVGSIYAAIALGFSLVFRVTGAINLSQGGFALIAAMIGYTFGVALGLAADRGDSGRGRRSQSSVWASCSALSPSSPR